MRTASRPFLAGVTLLAASLLAGTAQARMEVMSDGELAAVSGQGFVNLNTESSAGIDYTRINLGLNIDTSLNINKLQLGLYPRSGEAAGTADISINNFALGSVNDLTGQINPFKINDPFVELAYSGNKIVGMRVGFSESKGYLSGDIQTLSGSVPVHIKGTAGPVLDNSSGGTRFLLGLAGISRSTVLEADAELVASPSGNADPIRATHSGMLNGVPLNCTANCGLGGLSDALLSLFKSSGCAVTGTTTCFPLTQFQSLPVGNAAIVDNPATAAIEGGAKGFFIALQTQAVAWKDLDSGQYKTAQAGAFMNVPKYRDTNGNLVAPININFDQAFNGVPRVDTCLGTPDRGC
ncbi:MAG: hypothetical protein K2Y25_09700 [Pseudomonadaceae bacterium]|jgi:hypothetical protein|nr:hypothetical protein [Pseudomonadaceae bacterium]